MEFSYVAVNEKNRKYRNRMTANTKEEVKRKLEQRGLIAISINEVKKVRRKIFRSGSVILAVQKMCIH